MSASSTSDVHMEVQTTWLIVNYVGEVPWFDIVDTSRIINAPVAFTKGQVVIVVPEGRGEPKLALVVKTSNVASDLRRNFHRYCRQFVEEKRTEEFNNISSTSYCNNNESGPSGLCISSPIVSSSNGKGVVLNDSDKENRTPTAKRRRI